MPMTWLAGYWVSGVKVTVAPFTAKVPATYSLPQLPMQTSTVWEFTDAGLIRLLIVNITGLVTDPLAAPLTGLVEVSVNDPLPYEVVPVVNELVKVAMALPSMSLKPPTDTL